MRRLALVWCLLGIGCASKHAGVIPPMDSGADGKGGPEAAADVVAGGAVEAGPPACGTAVTIYDSTSGAVPTCTVALPPSDRAGNTFATYFNNSLIDRNASDGYTLSADGTEITLTGSYCTDIQSGAPSLVQVVFLCVLPPLW